LGFRDREGGFLDALRLLERALLVDAAAARLRVRDGVPLLGGAERLLLLLCAAGLAAGADAARVGGGVPLCALLLACALALALPVSDALAVPEREAVVAGVAVRVWVVAGVAVRVPEGEGEVLRLGVRVCVELRVAAAVTLRGRVAAADADADTDAVADGERLLEALPVPVALPLGEADGDADTLGDGAAEEDGDGGAPTPTHSVPGAHALAAQSSCTLMSYTHAAGSATARSTAAARGAVPLAALLAGGRHATDTRVVRVRADVTAVEQPNEYVPRVYCCVA
jgi:hypothetical protein